MTQYNPGTIDPDDTDGVELADLLNQFFIALLSSHSGASRPAYIGANGMWVKEVDGNTREVYFYDGTEDVLIGRYNPTSHMWTPDKVPLSKLASKSGDYTLLEGDNGTLFLCDASGAGFTLAGLAGADAGAGYFFAFQKKDSSGNAVTFNPDGSETVNGSATLAIDTQYDVFGVEWTGAEWSVVFAFRSQAAVLNKVQAWTKPQRPQAKQTATTSGSLTLDFESYSSFDITMNGDVSLPNQTLSSGMIGQKGRIRLIQDGTGGRALTSRGTQWKRIGLDTSLPELPSAANRVCRIDYEIVGTGAGGIEFAFSEVEA